MPHRNFKDLDKIAIIFVVVASILSGILHFIKRKNTQKSFWKLLLIFFADTTTTTIFAISTYLTLVGYDFNNIFAAGVSSLLAHNATRAIFLVELIIADKLGSPSAREAIKEEMRRENV